jgi:hypothetical protein
MAPTTTTAASTQPDLEVLSPVDGETVDQETVDFQGTGEPGSTVTDGGGDSPVGPDGTWTLPVTLEWGDNTVRITERDAAGNEAVVDVALRYTSPMPCHIHELDPLDQTELPQGPTVVWCGGWGYINSVDLAAQEIVFDLAQVREKVPGDESQGWEIINGNPGLRILPVNASVEVRACNPEPGEPVPAEGCGEPRVGEPWGFHQWTLHELKGFVDAGHDFWNVLVDPATGQVMWIEQWWSP